MEKPSWAFSKVTYFNFLQNEKGEKTFYFSDFEHNWDIFQFLTDKHTYYFVLNENIKSQYNFEIIRACYRQKCRHLSKIRFITTLLDQEDLIHRFPELPESISSQKYVERYNIDIILLRRFDTYTYQDAIDLFSKDVDDTIKIDDALLTHAIMKCIKKRRHHSFQSIAFFGASVTGQMYSYVDSIIKNKKDYGHSITKWGYGGCHINHATWLVDEVLPTRPSACILEWTTSVLQPTDADLFSYLHCIIDKLEAANIVPIFMYLYKTDIALFKNIIDIYETVANQRNISSLHCYDIVSCDISLSGLLKDSCHTTATGSNFYGSIIERCLFDYLANDNFGIQHKDEKMKEIVWKPLKNLKVINIDCLCDTRSMKSLVFGNQVYYRIDCLLRLQFQSKVNVWSANILFYKNNGFVEVNGDRLQTWDKNCYYKRFGFLDLKKDVDCNFEIKVLPIEPTGYYVPQ